MSPAELVGAYLDCEDALARAEDDVQRLKSDLYRLKNEASSVIGSRVVIIDGKGYRYDYSNSRIDEMEIVS